MDNVKTTIVALAVGDDTNTTHVTTTSGHGDHTGIELDEVSDLASGEIDLDCVVDLDGGIGVSDTARRNFTVSISRGKGIATVDLAQITSGESTKAWTNG